MLSEEIKDQILNTKINYLNGYLSALEGLNSFSVVGLRCKLFAYNFSAGDIEKCIQNNAYELFGVYPNDWNIDIEKVNDWEDKLKNLFNSFLKNRIPIQDSNQFDYTENDLVKDLSYNIRNTNEYFISMFKSEFVTENTDVYELKVHTDSIYRLIGIDLIFEIDETKILLLQIKGCD